MLCPSCPCVGKAEIQALQTAEASLNRLLLRSGSPASPVFLSSWRALGWSDKLPTVTHEGPYPSNRSTASQLSVAAGRGKAVSAASPTSGQ